ncbi:hypothetical protein [Thermodesulfobacterium sp.]|jgi:hypothetical protein|uniref:Uncharacterized protein n=1 Tax=Thermodesulfobacterium commune TaxID=1741 RepID=A0A3B8N3G3_9BACT|nr:hypothetical protein [Thermodesulfobacterium sp.]MBZ4682394.1 hypothetical protein [Thermodesulfobacterium sp.]MDK2861546.1 hypothetical protein [Thermodesulfobacterium sp.]MDN5380417.1 hypothetical protein [Thermodesulfobacterium sp.]HAA83655.1 hypothetical protein [Thermodesulfobacterium commune]
MIKKNVLDREYRLYKSLLKKEEVLFSFEGGDISVGDLRQLGLFPPIYVVVVDEIEFYNERLFKCVVLSEEIALAYLKDTPVIKLHNFKMVLACLPFWVYLMEDFLKNFSMILGKVSNFEKLIEYAEKTSIPDNLQGEYIRLEMSRLAPYNTFSLLNFLDTLSSYEESFQAIKVDYQVYKTFQEYAFSQAATSKNVFKGKNFFAFLERKDDEAKLILYLPQHAIGKKVKITFKDKVLFEGELETDKLIIEPLPFSLDYSILEEELDVQI